MLGTIMFFNESFTNIVTITFSALIITELLNVYSSVSFDLIISPYHSLGASTVMDDDMHISFNSLYIHRLNCTPSHVLLNKLYNLELRFESLRSYNSLMASNSNSPNDCGQM